MGAALDLHMEVDVVETGRFGVHTNLRIARDRRNLCVRGFAALAPVDDFEFTIRSDIPLSGGLGTSAAAFVAGLVAADSIFELGADVLAEAIRLEGHPDNVAAALLGGFVLCADAHVERFEPPDGLECLLVVPRPGRPHGQGARGAAVADSGPGRRLQHRPRLAARPRPRARRSLARRAAASPTASTSRVARTSTRGRGSSCRTRRDYGALGATISGAGPTVLVWCDFESTGAVAARLATETEGWAEVDARAVHAGRRGGSFQSVM